MYILDRACVVVALAGLLTFGGESKAEVIFNGIEYGSMSEAIGAINGTVDPGWFTPERSAAIGDALSDIAAKIAGDLANFAIASRAPGGAFGQEATNLVLNDQIESLTRSAIEYMRNRPDKRPMIEQLMEDARVSYSDINAAPFQYRGAIGYLEYEKELLNHIQQQLTLRAASEGRSSLPNQWIREELWRVNNALRDLRDLTGERRPPQEVNEITEEPALPTNDEARERDMPNAAGTETQPATCESRCLAAADGIRSSSVYRQCLSANCGNSSQMSQSEVVEVDQASYGSQLVIIGNEFLAHSSGIMVSIHGLANEGYFVYLRIPNGQIDYGCPGEVSDGAARQLLGRIRSAVNDGYLNLIEDMGCNERRRQ